MPRGGRRAGAPGTTYQQRSDLNAAPTQPIKTAPSQNYGDATAQAAAQKVVPLPGVQAPSAPQPPPLTAPTQRPTEPVTAGITSGPGAGPEALASSAGLSPDDQLAATLKGLYRAFPNSDLAKLVAQMDVR